MNLDDLDDLEVKEAIKNIETTIAKLDKVWADIVGIDNIEQ